MEKDWVKTMNKDDRKILKEQVKILQKYLDDMPCDLSNEESEVQDIIDELNDRIENAIGGKGAQLEEQKVILEDVLDSIQYAQTAMEEAIDYLEEAISGIESLL